MIVRVKSDGRRWRLSDRVGGITQGERGVRDCRVKVSRLITKAGNTLQIFSLTYTIVIPVSAFNLGLLHGQHDSTNVTDK